MLIVGNHHLLAFVANLKTEGKWGKLPSFAPKPPVRKDKAYRG